MELLDYLLSRARHEQHERIYKDTQRLRKETQEEHAQTNSLLRTLLQRLIAPPDSPVGKYCPSCGGPLPKLWVEVCINCKQPLVWYFFANDTLGRPEAVILKSREEVCDAQPDVVDFAYVSTPDRVASESRTQEEKRRDLWAAERDAEQKQVHREAYEQRQKEFGEWFTSRYKEKRTLNRSIGRTDVIIAAMVWLKARLCFLDFFGIGSWFAVLLMVMLVSFAALLASGSILVLLAALSFGSGTVVVVAVVEARIEKLISLVRKQQSATKSKLKDLESLLQDKTDEFNKEPGVPW